MAGFDWDVFISHASEDKLEVAGPLAERLKTAGLHVWYDRFTLTLGDNLRQKIDEGLARSKFGVVVLSKHFFAKPWPQRELDGLFALEQSAKRILPVWHNLSHDEIARHAPMLADRVAVKTSEGLDRVVEEITRAVKNVPTSPSNASASRPKRAKPEIKRLATGMGEEAVEILTYAAEHGGIIIAGRFDPGYVVSVGNHYFGDGHHPSQMAYKEGIRQLFMSHYIGQTHRDPNVYEVEARGYQLYEKLKGDNC
jgi:TIR domain